jgi:hypothetical protein
MANVQVPLGIGVYIGVQVDTVGVKPVGPGGPNGGTVAVLASALKVPVYVPVPLLIGLTPAELTVVLTKPVVGPAPPVAERK